MFFTRRRGDRYVDRGDVAALDLQVGSFTTNGTWIGLDLSSIVPAGATSVRLRIIIADETVSNSIWFAKFGESNHINISGGVVQAVDIDREFIIDVDCTSARVIQYMATNTTWTKIDLVIKGWNLK